MITAEQLQAICRTGEGKRACLAYLPFLQSLMPLYGIVTEQRAAAFLAQVAHESMDFTAIAENLNYSASRLAAVSPKRFRGPDGKPNAVALRLHRDPEAIANYWYGGRMGNGPEHTGDGYKFRGRGLKQLTGKANYRAFSLALGVDFVARPELLETPRWAVEAACWFWAENGLNELADTGDVEAVTRRINGGTNGLEQRRDYYARAQIELEGLTA